MGRVNGKVALISGGARGMGASHARLLASEGAKVVIGDLLDSEGEALAQELGEAARYVHLDVTDIGDWERAVDLAAEAFGGLDVLVNNAGIISFGPFEDYPLEKWNATIAVNLTGSFLGMQAALRLLKKSGAGSVVNISSVAGMQGNENLAAYIASKFGVRGLTKGAAIDLGKYGIRVNSVHPGTIRSPMTQDLEIVDFPYALRRIGEPEEVSKMVLFLASDESSFSTGAEFIVDGGRTAGRMGRSATS